MDNHVAGNTYPQPAFQAGLEVQAKGRNGGYISCQKLFAR